MLRKRKGKVLFKPLQPGEVLVTAGRASDIRELTHEVRTMGICTLQRKLWELLSNLAKNRLTSYGCMIPAGDLAELPESLECSLPVFLRDRGKEPGESA